MSGIAGIIEPPGAAKVAGDAARELELALRSQAHRGSGRPQTWKTAECALGVHEQAVTRGTAAGSSFASQNGCAILWDGRIDNRDELMANCGNSAPALSDAELVLRVYQTRGDACAESIRGDFVLAVWDEPRRRLYAARDIFGLRPFFYSTDGGRFRFASEIQALLRRPEIPREMDEECLGEFLLWWSDFPHKERTAFRGVRRLLPGHWLAWERGALRKQGYWQIDPKRQLEYRRHQDYGEEFQTLFAQAVKARVRDGSRCAIFLSGGMDSAAVAEQARREVGPAGELEAYCATRPGDPRDESHYAQQVAQRSGIPLHCIPIKPASLLAGLEGRIAELAHPLVDEGWVHEQRMLRQVAADGGGTILTGDGGDELFNFPHAYVADLLKGMRVGKLLGEMSHYARYHQRSRLGMLRSALPFLAPRAGLGVWKRLKWRNPPEWIDPDFARKINLLQRLRRVRPLLPFGSISAEHDYHTLTRGRMILVHECLEIAAARNGLTYRLPFYDQRLVEFMFAVPWEEKVTKGRVKSFLREAPGLLPEALCRLEAKGDYRELNEVFLREEDAAGLRELFEAPPPRAAEFIRPDVARRMCQSFLGGNNELEATVWMLACFYIWMKATADIGASVQAYSMVNCAP